MFPSDTPKHHEELSDRQESAGLKPSLGPGTSHPGCNLPCKLGEVRSKSTDADSSLWLLNRCYLYSLLYKTFAREPDEAFLSLLLEEQTSQSLTMALGKESPLSALREKAGTPLFLENLREEYTRLFVGPVVPASLPWESIYLTDAGLLFTERTLLVRSYYKAFGFLPKAYQQVPDDSLALELGFLAELAKESLHAWKQGNTPLLDKLLTGTYHFLCMHPLKWMDKLVCKIEETGSLTYALLGKTLLEYLKKDKEALARFLKKETCQGLTCQGITFQGIEEALHTLSSLSLSFPEHILVPSPEGPMLPKEASPPDFSSSHILEGGEWVNAPCWHNCGGKCLVRVYVKDGVILRQGTDTESTDDETNRQQRACLRGYSQKYQARGIDRLKYPMKRKHWNPGAPKGELRGIDEWERITWDEASTYIHDELKRITSTYGDNSVLAFGNGCTSLLNKLGINYLSPWTTSSWGSWYIPGVLGWGDGCNYYDCHNDRLDFLHCDYVVAFGYNPAWSALGNATNYALSWKKAGVKFIIFDPIYTDTSAILEATWIPIRPGTDMAAMMAMSYVLLTEDIDGSLIDWDFLDKCCVGQDKDHMPADARTDENYFDYLLGKYDGIPKTPKWAEEICGVPEDTLRRVARILGKDHNVSILSSWASARSYDTEQLPQVAICLGAMGGHIGKSGNSVGPTAWNHTNNYGPRLVKAGNDGPTGATYGGGKPTPICDAQLWKAVKGEPFNPTAIFRDINEAGPDGWKQVVAGYDLTKKVESITAPIHMIWTTNKAKLTTCEGAKEGIEAMRKVDFVVGQGHFLTATNQYADIVLPITTNWEREGSYVWEGYMNRDILLINRGMLPPFFEAKSDEEAMMTIGEKFGLSKEMWGTVPATKRLFHSIATSKVLKEDGKTWENLVSITKKDLEDWGVEGKPQEGRIPLSTYLKQGLYRAERRVGDNYGFIHKKEFREDPQGHPISTSSGKIEFACQALADILNSQGFSEEAYSAIPKYRIPTQGYEETFEGKKMGGKKNAYPLQCITPHYQRRAHSVFDNILPLREACPNPVFLSKADATARGIQDGDTVKISSKYGETLRKAYVTARLMPGVVGLPHGPWIHIREASGIDQAGSENYVTGQVARGLGVSGYNTLNVEVTKAGESERIPDDADLSKT